MNIGEKDVYPSCFSLTDAHPDKTAIVMIASILYFIMEITFYK